MRELIGEDRIAWFWANFEWFMVAWIFAVIFVVARNAWRRYNNEENAERRGKLAAMCHNWYNHWFNR